MHQLLGRQDLLENIQLGICGKKIKKLTCNKTLIIDNDRIRPESSEVDRLFCDNTKLIENTSWKPKYSLEQGINEVIEWMKNPKNLNSYKVTQYNV